MSGWQILNLPFFPSYTLGEFLFFTTFLLNLGTISTHVFLIILVTMKTYKGKTNEDYEIILEDEHLKFTITKSRVTKSGTYHYRDFYFKKKRTTFLFRSELFHLDLILKGQSTIHISLPKIKNETEINEIFRYTNDRRGFYKRLDKESLIKVKIWLVHTVTKEKLLV